MFTVATLVAKSLLNCVGTKTLCFMSLLVGAIGCILIGNPREYDKTVLPESQREVFNTLVHILIQFYDGKFGGYLMICISAAFMAVSVFEEVFESTGVQLMKTRFRLANGQQLYIETATFI